MICELDSLIGAALIVPNISGIEYYAQVGGTACFRRNCKGYLLPFNNDYYIADFVKSIEYKFSRIVNPSDVYLTPDIAIKMQEVLDESLYTNSIKINLEKINDSVQSWVYVMMSDTEFSSYYGFDNTEAILTWPNHD